MSARDRHPTSGGHAVVIGAGIAGLVAAQALAESFGQVTIIERDRLPDTARPRPGVPQGHHAHALAARGLLVLEELCPGLGRRLDAAGAPPVDFCREARHHWPAGVPEPVSSDVVIRPVSRPLLEILLREHVGARPEVRIMDGHQAGDLVGDAGAVTGVEVTPRGAGGRAMTMAADLVADASGRSSHLPGRLAAIGLPPPAEQRVDARVGYASRAYHIDPAAPPPWRALFETPDAPGRTRGCFALRIERDRLLITLQGAAGDHPGAEEDDFMAFMKSLRAGLADVVAGLEPATPIHRYRRSAGHRRLYHRLPSWPDGLIVLGDATCTLNPLYAQGMTVAALQARALGTMLRERPLASPGSAAAFQRRAMRISARPWWMSALADRAWTDSSPLVRAADAYLGACQRLAVADTAMFRDLAEVSNMLTGPAVLTRPRHLARLLRPRDR
ncbi:FAD-dependent oxidoreductase [Spongiactinospora rosea]|nr:FAD-dependent monooxygenase [Spongiactinospora rosea]